MIKKLHWLLPVFLLVACNNNTAEKAMAEHTGHGMNAGNKNYCDSVNNGLIDRDTLKGSPQRTAMATINGNHIHITYNSPGVKGRTIWGGLVAYDRVWATGAHMASTIQFSKAVEINGKRVAAGKYAVFTIPGKEKWIVILNTRFDQHLADEYSVNEDVLRIEVKPMEHEMVQRLTYQVNRVDDKNAEIIIQWEKIRIGVPVTSL